jgi:hypothetical protein
MKIFFSFLSFVLVSILSIVFGLYSYETFFSIVLSALVLIVSIGFQRNHLPFAISYLVESVAFCIVIVLGMKEVSRPVLQQSIILSIVMMVFLAIHIGFTIFGLYIVARKKESSVHLWNIVPLILASVLFAFFLMVKSYLALSVSLALILFSVWYQISR